MTPAEARSSQAFQTVLGMATRQMAPLPDNRKWLTINYLERKFDVIALITTPVAYYVARVSSFSNDYSRFDDARDLEQYLKGVTPI